MERPAGGAEGSEIVRYDAATGARSVLVASSALVPAGAKAPLDIDDYAWSADGKRLLIFTNTKRVWRQNTRGDYWVLDVAAGRLRKVGGKAPESSLDVRQVLARRHACGLRARATTSTSSTLPTAAPWR